MEAKPAKKISPKAERRQAQEEKGRRWTASEKVPGGTEAPERDKRYW